MSTSHPASQWIADRMQSIEASGIRKVFELARSLKDPVDLSIGQPHFDVPQPIKDAACEAIESGRNGYTVTQGIAELRAKILNDVKKKLPHPDRELFLTSGTSGGLLLALCCIVNPDDEVIFFDPYFVMYPHLLSLIGGKPVILDSYPNFEIDLNKTRDAITEKTKAIIVNSPANPTGKVLAKETLRDLALLAKEKEILLISDEIYSCFCYDSPFVSPAEFNEDVLVLDGFSKAYAMTGWRLGYAHGPRPLIEEMTKLQQFTFVCAPSMVQHAGLAAWDCDISPMVSDYKQKRDRIYEGLKDNFEINKSEGAFYTFPKAPWGTGSEFVGEAIRNNLLIIPGEVFSRADTHFRLSYAADDETIDRGLEILNRVAKR